MLLLWVQDPRDFQFIHGLYGLFFYTASNGVVYTSCGMNNTVSWLDTLKNGLGYLFRRNVEPLFTVAIRQDILRYLNHEEIVTHLREEELLTDEEAEHFAAFDNDPSAVHEMKNDFLLKAVEAKRLHQDITRKKFIVCLKREFQHLGHYQYLAGLLEREYNVCSHNDKHIFTDIYNPDRVLIDKELNERINKNQTFLKDIDFRTLVPVMRSKHLLTDTEQEALMGNEAHQCQSQDWKVTRLIHILNHKVPTAHIMFLDCLREETQHPTHKEFYERLSYCMPAYLDDTDPVEKDSVNSLVGKKRKLNTCIISRNELQPSKMKPKCLEMEGILAGNEYKRIMLKFQTWHHNGNWQAIDQQMEKYKQKANFPAELMIVALLETAISYTFRQDKEMVIKCVEDARALTLDSVKSGSNVQILEGRCEHVLTCLYRYRCQYEEASRHAVNSRSLLLDVKPGEDTSFARYCSACIALECHVGNKRISGFSTAPATIEHDFKAAISHARSHEIGMDVVESHSYIRLAQLYLHSQHFNGSQHTPDFKSLESARVCLEDAAKCLEHITSRRTRVLYHILKFDLHFLRNEPNEALKVLETCPDVELFSLQNRAVKHRIDTVKKLGYASAGGMRN